MDCSGLGGDPSHSSLPKGSVHWVPSPKFKDSSDADTGLAGQGPGSDPGEGPAGSPDAEALTFPEETVATPSQAHFPTLRCVCPDVSKTQRSRLREPGGRERRPPSCQACREAFPAEAALKRSGLLSASILSPAGNSQTSL